jgi:acyl-CoA thioesterase I
VSYELPSGVGGVAPVTVTCTSQPGAAFPVGSNTVSCTARDSRNQTAVCSFTVTVKPPVPRLSATKFMAFGDSITYGVTSAAPTFMMFATEGYPEKLHRSLSAKYTAQQLTVLNAGLPGENTQEGSWRLPGYMRLAAPDVVLLMEGANDLNQLGPAGVPFAAKNLGFMAQEVRMRGARLFIATLPPQRPGAPKVWYAEEVANLNWEIKEIARSEGAVLVDIYEALSADMNRYIGVDGLHPTEAGYERIAQLFFEAISVALELRPSAGG